MASLEYRLKALMKGDSVEREYTKMWLERVVDLMTELVGEVSDCLSHPKVKEAVSLAVLDKYRGSFSPSLPLSLSFL